MQLFTLTGKWISCMDNELKFIQWLCRICKLEIRRIDRMRSHTTEPHARRFSSQAHQFTIVSSRKLTPDSSRNSKTGVHVGEEALRVVFNLRYHESCTGIDAIHNHAGRERPSEAAQADPLVWVSRHYLRVRERETGRSGETFASLVNMGGRLRRALVLAAEAVEGDVVANDVLIAVDAVVVEADGAWQTASADVVGVNDLARSCDNAVVGGELKGVVPEIAISVPAVGAPGAAAFVAPVLAAAWCGRNAEGRQQDGGDD